MESNQLKLYNHFLESGQDEKAKEILKVYPQFAKESSKKSKK